MTKEATGKRKKPGEPAKKRKRKEGEKKGSEGRKKEKKEGCLTRHSID